MPFRGYIGEIEEISRRGTEKLTVEWCIRDLGSPCTGRRDCYTSPSFNIGDEWWWLRLFLYTRRDTVPETEWLKVDVVRLDAGAPKRFRYAIGIVQSGGMWTRGGGERLFLGRNNYQRISICSRSHLEQHLSTMMPEGALKIRCALKRSADREMEILQTSQQQNVLQTSQQQNVLQTPQQSMVKSGEDRDIALNKQATEELKKSLKSLLAGGEGSDCLIKVRSQEFPAHRTILQARSPVFRAMFSHDTSEKQSGVVALEDCDPEAFPAFLEHIYTGSIEMISGRNVFDLYSVSEKYDLPTLKKACADFVKKGLTIDSFCDAITLAVKYNENKLVEVATEFFCKNTLDIIKTEKWHIFLEENPKVANDLHIKKLAK